jgi:hypothetical protein
VNNAALVSPMAAMVALTAMFSTRCPDAERGQSKKIWLGNRSPTELSAPPHMGALIDRARRYSNSLRCKAFRLRGQGSSNMGGDYMQLAAVADLGTRTAGHKLGL